MFLECAATPNSGRAAAAESDSDAGSPVLPYTTPRRCDHGRGARQDKGIKQQLATTHEEQSVLDSVLERFVTSSPSRVEHLRRHAAIFFRRCA